MAVAHTPGPWQAVIDRKNARYRMILVDTGHFAIDATHSGATWEESAANAHLIAAAPKLLSALEECKEILAGIPAAKNNPRAADAIHKARAAISEAKGA